MKKNNEFSARVRQLTKQLLGEAYFGEASDYDAFFRSALEKFDIESPADLPDDKKDEFFDYVDKNWDAGDNETDVDEAIEPNKSDKPKIVDPSQTKIEKVDEASDVDDAIDSPGVEDFEKNVHDEPDPESDMKLEQSFRTLIRAELASMMSESKKKRLTELKRIDPKLITPGLVKKWNKLAKKHKGPMVYADTGRGVEQLSWEEGDGVSLVWVADQDGDNKEVSYDQIDFIEESRIRNSKRVVNEATDDAWIKKDSSVLKKLGLPHKVHGKLMGQPGAVFFDGETDFNGKRIFYSVQTTAKPNSKHINGGRIARLAFGVKLDRGFGPTLATYNNGRWETKPDESIKKLISKIIIGMK